MVTARWNGEVLARSDNTMVVEGNHYFPPGAVNWEALQESDHHSTCPWKGRASYYDVVANDDRNPNAAWTYPDPSPAAEKIKDYIAFWHGVRVTDGD